MVEKKTVGKCDSYFLANEYNMPFVENPVLVTEIECWNKERILNRGASGFYELNSLHFCPCVLNKFRKGEG